MTLTREETTTPGIMAMLLGLFLPVAGIFVAAYVRNRARERGVDDTYARLGFQIAAFILITGGVFAAVGFTIAVIIPLVTAAG